MNNKKTLGNKIKNMGPAAIITSAFIGPGTVTVATLSGFEFGYSLLWVVGFSIISLIVLMEMSSRIGIIGRKNLIEAGIALFPENKIWGGFIKVLIVFAVASVGLAFESGNMTGASAGLSDLLGVDVKMAAIITGIITFVVSIVNSAKIFEKVMKFFVSLMSVIFIFTMIILMPNFLEVLKGLFIPSIPENAGIRAMALMGTTLIGINLILHSITSQDKWNDLEGLEEAKVDILFNILLGGLITLSIIVTSATVLHGTNFEFKGVMSFATALEPVLGKTARFFAALGIFAAGLSSAIAVPFTLKTTFSRVFHWKGGTDGVIAKVIGGIIVAFGTALAMSGINPIQIIVVAQTISGFFLPFIALILLIVSNNKNFLQEHVNNTFQNVFGFIAVVVSFAVGSWGLYQAIPKFLGLFVK